MARPLKKTIFAASLSQIRIRVNSIRIRIPDFPYLLPLLSLSFVYHKDSNYIWPIQSLFFFFLHIVSICLFFVTLCFVLFDFLSLFLSLFHIVSICLFLCLSVYRSLFYILYLYFTIFSYLSDIFIPSLSCV